MGLTCVHSALGARLVTWILSSLFFCLGAAAVNTSSSWPLLDNGLQHTVQWDHYSLQINGERVLLFGGEMHPFRLPVPELWEDVLQKVKATGMRMISIYTHWGFHALSADKVDFSTGAHNLTRFLEMARDVGLYVQVRPGPYINGELNAGGMALWSTTGAYGTLRLNGTAYTDAWMPYQSAVADAVRPFQLTANGTVILYQIENEYGSQWRNVNAKTPNKEAISYMEKLEENAREHGILVPLTHNAPNQNGRAWSKDYDTVGAGGDVDIYGLDSYPQCWSCVTAECGTVTPWQVSNYYDHFQLVSPKQPSYMPEFQGGAMNPWAGPATGCQDRTGVDFVNFYYRDNLAQRVTMLSLYMIYGGTNWGWLAAPFMGSSYDYSAAISEDRSIGDKYYEIKNLGLFTRVADELAFTERIGTGTGYTNNTNLFTTELRNPETGAAFYFIRHVQTASASEEWFALKVNTSIGEFYVPKISSAVVTSGHEGKVLVADFHFGNNTLLYATAEVLTYAIIDGKATLVLWTPSGRSGEFYLQGAKSGSILSGQPAVTIMPSDHGIIVGWSQEEGMTVLEFDNGVRVVLVDRITAYKLWVPAMTNDPKVPVDQTALVVGPYLVRSATVSGNTISINGDANSTTAIKVFTSSSVSKIRWNGVNLPTTKTNHSSLIATIAGPDSFPTPKIRDWKSCDSLPERNPSYSDAGKAWVLANATTTPNSAVHTNTTTKPYLLADQYGFHTGIRLWRGHFTTGPNTPAPTGVFLRIQGGTAHAWSAYLNGHFLGSWAGDSTIDTSNLTLAFPNGTLYFNHGHDSAEADNVLLVLHDDTGHDEQAAALNPRGILNATLLTSPSHHSNQTTSDSKPAFKEWKVAGTAPLDPLRTIYNEGGLAAERGGWHLPGYDDSAWQVATPADGFPGAGVRFYRGRLPLHVPRGMDASLALRFKAPPPGKNKGEVDSEQQAFRVLLFVNGWQFGRYYPSIQATDTFPVPAGVLDYDGEDNVVGLAVWALQEGGARVEVEVVVRYAVMSSFDARFEGGYLRSGWTAERREYA